MQADSPPQTMLDVLASEHAVRGPAPAILAPGRDAISYAALRVEIDRAGEALAALGLGRGNRIAIALADGPDAGLAMLAAMNWATCAPLNPGLDFDGCTVLLAQLRVDALIAAEGDPSPVTEAARAAGLPIVRLAAGAPAEGGLFALRAETGRAPVALVRPRPEDVALVMHTSGTTARPKVVPVTHSSVLWAARARPIDASDRCLCVSPLHTSNGLRLGLISPLVAGASTVLSPGFDVERFFEWLDAFGPTYFSANPTVHAAIIDAFRHRARALPASLRFVRSSSNGMTAQLQEQLEDLWQVPVIQGYGSTEGGAIAQDSPPPGRRRAGSVGIVRSTEVRIADERGEPLPDGATGEILVRGPGVMHGYENDPEGNRLAFHGEWFRTGDLGYVDADGYLFLVGRIKELINRGGLKVAPAEVDAIFARHPAVSAAATVGIAHPSLGEDVVTAVILQKGEAITAQELRGYALKHLPAFKAPSAVVVVDEFPRTVLGKVRRGALAESLSDPLRVDFVPPRDAEETLVAGIFAWLLDRPRVGAHDNFFSLGGDSLGAARAISRVCAQAGVEMGHLALFEAPTVEQFAQRLRAAKSGTAAPDAGVHSRVRRSHRRAAAATGSASGAVSSEE